MLFTALLGNPVEHSVSTYLYSEFANFVGLEYTHIKLNVPTEADLGDYLQSLRRIGCIGINITIPYKLAIAQHLDRQDNRSLAIGAVNTITINEHGSIGYNTDGIGAYRSIETYLRPVTPLDRVVVLGSGGAARAIVYELYQRTDNITILGIDQAEMAKLADDFQHPDKKIVKFATLDQSSLFEHLETANFLVNSSPIGMYPETDQSLISAALIDRLVQVRDLSDLFVFDAIFNPHTTLMLDLVAKAGAPVCSGLWMLIYHGVEAFRLWTGKDVSHAPLDEIELKLRQVLLSQYQHA